MNWLSVIAYSLSGILNSIDVLITITGAIIVMNILKESGGMHSINNGFRTISKDARIQAIIVGWMFSSFIEGVATRHSFYHCFNHYYFHPQNESKKCGNRMEKYRETINWRRNCYY